MRALHLAPHPDDEILGAGATLTALREAGHDVTNLGVSLGRRAEREHRRAELEAACERLALPLEVLEPPLEISVGDGDDLDAAEARLTALLLERLGDLDLIIAPSPHDAHPGHELVGRAAVAATAAAEVGPRLWLWGIWASLPLPTLISGFDEATLARLLEALAAHASQITRNDYESLLRAKATADAILGPERVLGYSSRRGDQPYAELLCELLPSRGDWLLGSPRVLDSVSPLSPPTGTDAADWLTGPSPNALLRESD